MKTIDWEYLAQHMHPREPESDKNTYGRVLAVCGCRDYIGAPFFAAQAAVRTGSGIVTLALPSCIYPVLAAKLNEPTFVPLETGADGKISADCLPSLERRAAILAGPGLGISEGVTQAVQTIIEQAECPLVLDADGINALAGHIDVVEKAKYPVILTPHKHEFARICDVPSTEHREAMASAFAKKHRCVLSGIILSLLGQGLEPLAAAACGAYIHSRAGDLCANDIGEFGMTPTDMLRYIPRVLKPLNSREW